VKPAPGTRSPRDSARDRSAGPATNVAHARVLQKIASGCTARSSPELASQPVVRHGELANQAHALVAVVSGSTSTSGSIATSPPGSIERAGGAG
jgi:hypothetical protein